jgi:hypothetical protein
MVHARGAFVSGEPWSLALSSSPALAPTADDFAALDSLAGARPLSHRYRVLCDNGAAAIAPLTAAVTEAGGALSGLVLNAYGPGDEIRLRVGALSCADARALSDRLHALPGITFCQVEHQWA